MIGQLLSRDDLARGMNAVRSAMFGLRRFVRGLFVPSARKATAPPSIARITPSNTIEDQAVTHAATPTATPVALGSTNVFQLKPAARTSKKRRKTQVKPDMATFSELLSSIEDSFSTMSIPAIKGNWLPKKDIKALHKLGIHVPSPWEMERTSNPTIPAGEPLPAMASCTMIPSKYDTPGPDGRVYPRFIFAIKEPKLPADVEAIKGTPYRFGYCVELPGDTEDAKDKTPRLFWVWAWFVVKADGSICIPSELRPAVQTILHRRSLDGRARRESFVSRQWSRPTITRPEAGRTKEETENFLACTFRQLLLWWNSRGSRWSVAVRKDGKRVTFSIAPEHTAAYFADRDLVVTSSGSKKKIVHFVAEHTRANGQVVKAHVRGLRDFDWKGYRCIVTAPDLCGNVVTTAAIYPIEVKRSDDDRAAYLDNLELASRLADSEDRIDAPNQRAA